METNLPEALAQKIFRGKRPSRELYVEALDELQARWDTIERAQFEAWGALAIGNEKGGLIQRSVGRHWWVRGMGSAAEVEETLYGEPFTSQSLRMTATHCRWESRSNDAGPSANTTPTRKIRSPHRLTYLDRALYENNRLGLGTAISGEKRILLIWESTPEELTNEHEKRRRMYRKHQKKDWGANGPKPNRYDVTIQSFDIATGHPATERHLSGHDDTPNRMSRADYMAVDWDEAGYRAALAQ